MILRSESSSKHKKTFGVQQGEPQLHRESFLNQETLPMKSRLQPGYRPRNRGVQQPFLIGPNYAERTFTYVLAARTSIRSQQIESHLLRQVAYSDQSELLEFLLDSS
ncbi:hypothetical protein Mal48_02880 [Thalassoglobus polymorphus]|uniref:Uncharacterized protein n=1 Tax=Thalassoglobus polymorphus TaxID=2527994 RepID=A0A517QHM5_9PLAN|nr:hypothetical protein Mal48_02880 [Thalassoglobus polymorphus]